MASMTFQVNDASTSGGYPAVWVTITENADGSLSFSITQQGGIIGDLRGLFFDVADESLIGTLQTNAQTSDFRQGNDTIKDLGDGANMNGLLGSDAAQPKVAGAEGNGYDVGIEVGSAGIGKDDIQSYNFTLSSNARALTLQDFANVDFGVRLTSVGTIDGSRDGSSKILEKTSAAINAQDDSACVNENASTTGNVLDNDKAGLPATDVVTVTGWSGGALGETIQLANAAGATLSLDASGNYVLDANSADALSEGEHLVYTFTYDAKSQNEATSWSNDTATFTVCVDGKNDGPVAGDDAASTVENSAPATGTVVANDSDIDRLDTISVASWSGGDLGSTVSITNGAGATFTLNADGSYVLDASSADALSEGETITQNFTYTLADNNGATDDATISVTVTGVNDGPLANDDAAGCIKENETLANQSVTGNDADVDRLDTHTWSLVSFDGQGNLVFNEDGTWSYDTAGAYDDLNDGEHVDLSFQYAMTDNHGASDTATVSFCVQGVGSITPPPPPPPPVDNFANNGHELSYVTFYFGTRDGDVRGVYNGEPTTGKNGSNDPDGVYTVKIQFDGAYDTNTGDFDDYYALALQRIIDVDPNVDANTVVLGVAIHAGEGDPKLSEKFYALDGDPDADPYPNPPVDAAINNEVDFVYSASLLFAVPA